MDVNNCRVTFWDLGGQVGFACTYFLGYHPLRDMIILESHPNIVHNIGSNEINLGKVLR